MKRPVCIAALALTFVTAVYLAQRTPGPKGGGSLTKEENGALVLEEGAEYVAAGKVERVESRSAAGKTQRWIFIQSVSVQETAGEGKAAADIFCGLICKTDAPCPPKIGSVVRVRGRFSGFSRATNPGEFDSSEYYRILRVGGTLNKAEILEESESYSFAGEMLSRLRNFWKERLYGLYPEKEASILCAMLLGDKFSLDPEIKELYQRNGIVHILSISGLHITLIGMGLYRLLRKAGLPVFPAAAAGSAVLIAYGLMTGMSVSACRAVGMYLIRMLGEILGRTYDMMTALGVMAVLMLIKEPEYLRHSGFLLSFGSVCGIGLLLPALSQESPPVSSRNPPFVAAGGSGKFFRKKLKTGIKCLGRYFLRALSPGLAVSLFTLPVQLWFYYEIPVYSLFLNLLVLPFMGVVMGSGLISMLLPSFLRSLSKGSAFAGCLVLGAYEKLCGFFERLPGHTWRPGCPAAWQVVVYYLILAAFLAGRKYQRKRAEEKAEGKEKAGKMGRAVLCLLPVLAVFVIGVRFHSGLEVTFLDVGQGDGIFVRTQAGEAYLFDCGSSSEQGIGEYTLLPFLKYQGVSRIDAVFISHPDADHDNGILELLELGDREGITVKKIFLPDIAPQKQKEELGKILDAVESCAQSPPPEVGFLGKGDAWKSGGTVFRCLHPESGASFRDTNEYSLCFLLSQGEFSMLLTGDVQGEGEEELVKTVRECPPGNITLLKVAHHGSRNSTPEELLKLLSPQIAVISCGRDNSYGHPHDELVARLKQAGCRIYMTPDAGALTVRLKGDRLRVAPFLSP